MRAPAHPRRRDRRRRTQRPRRRRLPRPRGQTVVVLERLDHLGGAAVSERPVGRRRRPALALLVPREPAPPRIIDDLGLRIDLRRRRYSSYTPDPADPSRGILIDTADAAATAASFARATGDPREADRSPRSTIASRPVARHALPDRHRAAAASLGRARDASATTRCGTTLSSARSGGCCARRSRPISRAASR